jgi:hypothetical protein
MKYLKLLLASILASTGCTSLALERHTLSQGASPTDIRYQEVMDNLAMVAKDPFALPAFSSIFAGTAQITDTASLISTTTIGPGVAGQTINPSWTRAVTGNWTLDPINTPEKLEAMRCCCRWVVYGQEFAVRDCGTILLRPEQACTVLNPPEYQGRHFGVYERLCKMPQHWLAMGRRHDVPPCARYKARCGDTWVWVTPENLKGLADFSLILQDIARVDINSPTIFCIRQVPSDFLFPSTSPTKPRNLSFKCPPARDCCPVQVGATPPLSCPETNKTLPNVVAEVSVDPCGKLMPDNPYYRYRVENAGSDPYLRSQISASASGLH